MQLSSIIGKQVLTPSGKAIGYVKDAFLNRKCTKLACLCCIDSEEDAFFLPSRAVRAYGDVLIVTSSRLPTPVGIPSPIGKCVYSHLGEALGTVCDVVFDDEESPRFIVCNRETQISYPVSRIILGENAIVREERPAAAPSVSICEQPASHVVHTGLLGKRVQRTVYDGEGNPIIPANERITAQTLQRARKHNKLLQLTANTLTNLPT